MLLIVVHALWACIVSVSVPLWLSLPMLALVLTLHSSLQHELPHGHPFADVRLDGALGWQPLTLAAPYWHIRALPIDHHRDERLTGPCDDPEKNCLDPAVWARLGPAPRALPRAYRLRRAYGLRRNGGYRYRSYAEVFQRHLLRAKDPAPRPLWPDC